MLQCTRLDTMATITLVPKNGAVVDHYLVCENNLLQSVVDANVVSNQVNKVYRYIITKILNSYILSLNNTSNMYGLIILKIQCSFHLPWGRVVIPDPIIRKNSSFVLTLIVHTVCSIRVA